MTNLLVEGKKIKKNESLKIFFSSCSKQAKSVIIHEMLHTLGFFHEQNRIDRDDFVVVNWENIRAGKAFNFFRLQDPNRDLPNCRDLEGPIFDDCDKRLHGETYGTPYDYNSIMHYERNT